MHNNSASFRRRRKNFRDTAHALCVCECPQIIYVIHCLIYHIHNCLACGKTMQFCINFNINFKINCNVLYSIQNTNTYVYLYPLIS